MPSDPPAAELSPLLPSNTRNTTYCQHASCAATCKFVAKAITHAVLVGGSYLAYIGGREAYAMLLGENDIGQIITGASSALVMYRLLADAAQDMWSGNNEVDLQYLKKTLFPSLFLAGCNAFTSGLLTFKNAPLEWQKWCFSVITGIASVPFGMLNSAAMIRNIKDYESVWNHLSIKQKGILFLNFMIIFLIVCCALLGGGAPLIQLFVRWFKDLFGGASFAAYVGAGLMAPIFSCVELFFQLNNMLYLGKDEETPNNRVLIGYLRNPYSEDAWQHKIRSLISTILAIMCSLNFAAFTGQIFMDMNYPLAISLGIIALIGPTWSNIKPADAVICKPLETLAIYLFEKFTGGMSNAWNYCGIGMARPKLISVNGADVITV